MNDSNTTRRDFLKKSAVVAGGIGFLNPMLRSSKPKGVKNKLPEWKGFNLLDFFEANPAHAREQTPEIYMQWMEDWGFDFVRIPMAYPAYLKIDHNKDITAAQVRDIDPVQTERITNLVYLANKHHLHVSLNLHRAPGFCVNAGFHEPYNLWKDPQALDDFCYHWAFWARQFKDLPQDMISFDLVNEPCMREDMNDQLSKRSAVPGNIYARVIKTAADAIWQINPQRMIIADGNNIGSEVIPEIIGMNIGQSCRGYYPAIISHYKAPWVFKDPENLPLPKWPGRVNNRYLSKAMLEEYYRPWIDAVHKGVGVHCGECGCWNKTPHDVFLAWFSDVLDILRSHGIGYALWEFRGSFGILDSGREDVEYEDWHGHKLDRKLLDLLAKR